MQQDSQKIYKTIGYIISKKRKESGIKYTDFCYENDIPMSTYDDIVKGRKKSSFYNIAKIVKALGFSFEEFGKLLDEHISENFVEQE